MGFTLAGTNFVIVPGVQPPNAAVHKLEEENKQQAAKIAALEAQI